VKQKLLDRFKPALSPAAMKLLRRLLDATTSIEKDDEGVRCTFPDVDDGDSWVILPPNKKPKKAVPAAHKKFLAVCGGMIWGEVGNTGQVVLTDGFDGTLHALGDDALDAEVFGFPYSASLFSPIDLDSGDFYVTHPKTGKLLYQTEGVVSVVQKTTDPVEIYLREMCFEVLPGSPHRNTWLRDL
jgi:hypothetical protein